MGSTQSILQLFHRSLRNSLFCNVLQDGSKQIHGIISICNGRLMQTSAAEMLGFIPICLRQLPSMYPLKRRRSLPQGSGPTFQDKSRKRDGLQRVRSMEVKVPLAESKICMTFVVK